MIEYNGMKLEEVTAGYWPDGVTLVAVDGSAHQEYSNVVCLCNSVAFFESGTTSSSWWPNWAILPPKPPARRLTNREVACLCRKGWDVDISGTVFQVHYYYRAQENDLCGDSVRMLRSPDSGEWVEPTSEVLD